MRAELIVAELGCIRREASRVDGSRTHRSIADLNDKKAETSGA